jgi:hypothetical protein
MVLDYPTGVWYQFSSDNESPVGTVEHITLEVQTGRVAGRRWLPRTGFQKFLINYTVQK